MTSPFPERAEAGRKTRGLRSFECNRAIRACMTMSMSSGFPTGMKTMSRSLWALSGSTNP